MALPVAHGGESVTISRVYWAIFAASLTFWLAWAVVLNLVVWVQHNDPSGPALVLIYGPLLLHVVAAVHGDTGRARFLLLAGFLGAAVGALLLIAPTLEQAVQADWAILYQLEWWGPPRTVWGAIGLLIGGGLLWTFLSRPSRRW
jgi:hypothetical protein